jgi:hypothetical protein
MSGSWSMYYVLLQSHITEADKADLGGMLLISANIAEMVQRENRQPFLQCIIRRQNKVYIPSFVHPQANNKNF